MTPPGDQQLLARLDERTANMAEDLADLKANYVTKTEFAPVRAIVFGGVVLVLVAFMGALIALAGLK
jgi:hypothetical protein